MAQNSSDSLELNSNPKLASETNLSLNHATFRVEIEIKALTGPDKDA